MNVQGSFQYLDASVEPSLFRNGKLWVRRNADGNDSEPQGLSLKPQTFLVRDARALKPGLLERGFVLVDRPLSRWPDFYDHSELVQKYYPDCAELVAEVTGAAHVFAFDHNVRSAGRERGRIRGGQQVQTPLHLVHGDYTLTSAPQRLEALTRPPSGNDTLRLVLPPGRALIPSELAKEALERHRRFAMINVWRNIDAEPVMTHPLALCDGQSVKPEALSVFEIHYQDRVGENYFARPSDEHRWHYYPRIRREEALLIKQWDSEGRLAKTSGQQDDGSDGPCTFSFHSAFVDPTTPQDAPDRRSIEVRCLALF